MTKAQQKAIDAIKADIVRLKSHGRPDEHEFKKFVITESQGTRLVFLIAEYGLIGDEADGRRLLFRDRRHFAIGARGGVKLLSLSANLRSTSPTRVRGVFASVNYWHPRRKEA